jgi:hypothetical protein
VRVISHPEQLVALLEDAIHVVGVYLLLLSEVLHHLRHPLSCRGLRRVLAHTHELVGLRDSQGVHRDELPDGLGVLGGDRRLKEDTLVLLLADRPHLPRVAILWRAFADLGEQVEGALEALECEQGAALPVVALEEGGVEADHLLGVLQGSPVRLNLQVGLSA